MPGNDHLSDLSSRETLGFCCNLLYYLFGNSLHLDKSFRTIQTPWVLPCESCFLREASRWLAVFNKVMEEHDSPLIFIGQVEANNFINTIMDSLIELFRVVSGQYQDYSLRGATCAIEERVDRMPHVLRNLISLSASKEGIRLIDEENHTSWL